MAVAQNISTRVSPSQGVRRSAVAALLLVMFAWAVDGGQSWEIMLSLGMLSLWALYGVYRTIAQARASPQTKDLVLVYLLPPRVPRV